jgi:SAM-dependent methyltransferase
LKSRVRSFCRTLLHAPGVRIARRAAERAVTPEARIAIDGIGNLQSDVLAAIHREHLRLEETRRSIDDIEHSVPAVLNAISSMNGAARIATREVERLSAEVERLRTEVAAVTAQQDAQRAELTARLDADRAELTARLDADRAEFAAEQEALHEAVRAGDLDVLGQVRPHAETLGWLMRRVEVVRFEMLNEIRYGTRDENATAIEAKVVNKEALESSPLRINIGAGHIPLDGYVNVDMRELPGIDVVATVDLLPFEPGTVDEIFSSHTLEHFPEELLRRKLLPYWISLLKPGGKLTTVAPDLEAMSGDFVNGKTSFEDFRSVLYGGQEYEGDSHYTGFTPSSFCELLVDAGMVDPVVVACDRVNGLCKEFEITARKAE